MNKYVSRKFILSVVTFATGSALAFYGKLSYEFIALCTVVYGGFNISDVVEKKIKHLTSKEIGKIVSTSIHKEDSNGL